MCLRRSERPEFDAWRWSEYWVALENVVEFKREVYYQALVELSRFIPAVAVRRAGSAVDLKTDPEVKTA